MSKEVKYMGKFSALPALLFSVLLLSMPAYAEPPYLEMYYIDSPEEHCLERAEASLTETGFKMKKGTWEGYDRVGSMGDYKAAVSCVQPKNVVAIVVAGPVYKTVNEHALAIRENFKHWFKVEEAP